MSVTSWDGEWRESDVQIVEPADPDYEMWCSFHIAFKESKPTVALITDKAVARLREMFRTERERRFQHSSPTETLPERRSIPANN